MEALAQCMSGFQMIFDTLMTLIDPNPPAFNSTILTSCGGNRSAAIFRGFTPRTLEASRSHYIRVRFI